MYTPFQVAQRTQRSVPPMIGGKNIFAEVHLIVLFGHIKYKIYSAFGVLGFWGTTSE